MTAQNWAGLPRLAWLQALREPQVVLEWSLADWERVIRLARRLRLLARIGASVDAAGLLHSVPALARRHLLAEQRLSLARTTAMVWAIRRVAEALDGAPYPRVLLKGAAYIGQSLQIATGRLPSDVDILVPRSHMADAQARLSRAGWQEIELDEHDQRYYRDWSHEAPPMRHPAHRMELDLHHNILPPVARTTTDAGLLMDDALPSDWPGWSVLAPEDQLLHSAAHLFLDSELRDRLRDLVDLDGLFRHFGQTDTFWPRLHRRAAVLGLEEPLALACHFCVLWLGTPVPSDTMRYAHEMGQSVRRRAWLLPMLKRILMPTEPDQTAPVVQDFAAALLLARYHRNRMPLRLLVPHVWHKLRPPKSQVVTDAVVGQEGVGPSAK